ncbi:MAG: helix-turn-helix domain-containing protein [Elusimicrobia bacterium]|nr:helix-turn-helix domain-containing protein [Elusimicrobiota bacterium]
MEKFGSRENLLAEPQQALTAPASKIIKRRKKSERILPLAGVPDVMDIKELSGYLGLGKSKIYALISAKKIPASKIGRQYRFSRPLIDSWLQERVITDREQTLPLFQNKDRQK